METVLASAGFQLFPPLRSRSDLQSYWNKSWDGIRYGVMRVENYIDDKVMDLIHAIQFISYLFLGLILLIILVGIRNTTQIMTRKRFKEIGTIRALGMSKAGAQRMVLGESVLVASLGFMIGLSLSVGILLVIQLIPLDLPDGFDIFLRKGHLSWQLSPLFIAINYVALALMTAAGSLPAARRAASISPASAIATND
jgi:putative ABC transport system permease protein